MIAFRTATAQDAAGIRAVYAPYIETTVFTFETELPTVQDIAARIEKGLKKFPWIVCTIDGTIAGYVYASAHRDREAYQWTCECSVYIDARFHGRGLGPSLYSALFQILKMQGLKTVYAGITLPNEPSVRLHEKCGFEHFATYEQVGYKFNNWQKVGWWRLQLNDYSLNPTPPLDFSAMDQSRFTSLLQKSAEGVKNKA
jgi:phosphinothricin acetyltransferase